jgi:ribose transport system substrate-binding protein
VKQLLRLGMVLSGLLSLTAFIFSMVKARQVYVLAPDPGPALIYHFSLYLPDNRNTFFKGIILGAERAARELNSAVSVHSIDPLKHELETAAFTGVDGVIVCPYLDDTLARRQMEQFREYQIPVVLINHNLASDQPWPFIGTNNFDMGRRIGFILQNHGSDPAPPGPGSSGTTPSGAALRPVRLAIVYSDKSPGIYAERELVEMGISAALGDQLSGPIMRLRTNFNPLDAEALLVKLFRESEELTEDTAEAFPINTIVFTDSADTIAAAQTLVDMNLVGRMQVIGFGSDPEIIENIRKGIILCSVTINSERIGYEAIRSITALRTTGYTSTSIDTGIDIITGKNL